MLAAGDVTSYKHILRRNTIDRGEGSRVYTYRSIHVRHPRACAGGLLGRVCLSKFGVLESVPASPSKFGVYVKVQSERLCYSLPFAWRPSRISSAASCCLSPSPACLWYHPPTVFRAKEPSANTNCQEKYQLGRESLANVA